jgi:hypothetical protein
MKRSASMMMIKEMNQMTRKTYSLSDPPCASVPGSLHPQSGVQGSELINKTPTVEFGDLLRFFYYGVCNDAG